ncbi:coiled-coil and c2 domain-containing protein 1a [Plakobranchus ocellatus]|uniref:Coiled-coil and c2 domain-containing protein 1a n=1 Tax=Plakobranchus ocellatus TaxID=259542 RepID=A0AAV3ZH01_9GAST|nr:coiled-coil and c2 domain-containing protein 1a [Plakobranchus ocellatus]
MYISAMDTASAVNDSNQSSQLQRDIQKLVDLMERVGAGEEIMESQVPPPLAITPQIDVLPNALGELSSRLADYHKALYFAEEELSEDRLNKIQGFQRALQAIHNLQKRAEAGFPIRADEVPPPVAIPDDNEFDNDAVNTLTSRIAQYREALSTAEQAKGTDRRRITKLQSTLRTLEFLMTRAKAKRPVWKKDIPPEFDYCNMSPKGSPTNMNKTKYLLVLRSLILRLSAPTVADSDVGQSAGVTHKKLKALEEELVKNQDAKPWLQSDNSLPALTKVVEKLEKLAAKKKEVVPNASQDMTLLETRIQEYTAAALKAKRENQMPSAIKHFKVLKGLQALKESLEKGDAVDMTLVPPSPRDYTPTSDSPQSFAKQHNADSRPDVGKRSSQSETARLLPVNVRPTVETAEDKLAQKLSSYLDLSDDDGQGASALGEKNLVTNNTGLSKSTAKLLKKVQNSAIKLPAEKVLYGDPGYSDSLSSGDKSMDHQESDTESKSKHSETSDRTEAEDKNVDNKKSRMDEVVEKDKGSKEVEHLGHPQNDKPTSNHELESKEESPDTITDTVAKETEPKQSSPKSSPKSSSDVYSRKTLDSVGFLSCQTVPVPTEHVKAAMSGSEDAPTANQINHGVADEPSSTSPQVLDGSQAKVAISEEASFLSLGVSQAGCLIDSQSKDKDSSVENTNSAENQLSSTEKAEKAYDSDDKVIQASMSHSKEDLHNGFAEKTGTSGESLPNELTPVASHIPPADTPGLSNGLIKSLKSANETETPSSSLGHMEAGAEGVGASSHPSKGNYSIPAAGSKVQTDSEQRVFHNTHDPEHHILKKETAANSMEGNTPFVSSSEELEFQDLMESMSLPPALSNPSGKMEERHSSNSKPPLCSKDAEKVSESIPNSVAFGAQNIPQEQRFKPDLQKPSGSFQRPEISLGNRNSSDGAGSGSQMTFPQHASSFPMHSSVETGSKLDHQPMRTTDSAIQSLSANNIVLDRARSQHKSQSDVMFTCLENLKYDLLVEKSKNASANSVVIVKLESRMEEIKDKLRSSGRLIWELYKNCVELELASLAKEITNMQGGPKVDNLCILQHKQKIANRELNFLLESLPKLSY